MTFGRAMGKTRGRNWAAMLVVAAIAVLMFGCANLFGPDSSSENGDDGDALKVPEEVDPDVRAAWESAGFDSDTLGYHLRLLSIDTDRTIELPLVYLGIVEETYAVGESEARMSEDAFYDWMNTLIEEAQGTEYEPVVDTMLSGHDQVGRDTELAAHEAALLATTLALIPAAMHEEATNPGEITGSLHGDHLYSSASSLNQLLDGAGDLSGSNYEVGKAFGGFALYVGGISATILTAPVSAPAAAVAGIVGAVGLAISGDGVQDIIDGFRSTMDGSRTGADVTYDPEGDGSQYSTSNSDPDAYQEQLKNRESFDDIGVTGAYRLNSYYLYDTTDGEFESRETGADAELTIEADSIEREVEDGRYVHTDLWVSERQIYSDRWERRVGQILYNETDVLISFDNYPGQDDVTLHYQADRLDDFVLTEEMFEQGRSWDVISHTPGPNQSEFWKESEPTRVSLASQDGRLLLRMTTYDHAEDHEHTAGYGVMITGPTELGHSSDDSRYDIEAGDTFATFAADGERLVMTFGFDELTSDPYGEEAEIVLHR